MAFKKNPSQSSVREVKPVVRQAIQRKPKTWLFVLAMLPLLVLVLWTLKNISVSSKPAKSTPLKINTTRQTPQELAEEATEALRTKNTQAFFDLLRTKITDPNIVNSRGDSLLLAAVTMGNVEAVEHLLALGADVNQQNYNTRDTAVLRSVYMGHDEITRLLVYDNADLNLSNNYHQTPMSLAVDKKNYELINLFLQNGVKAGLDANTLFRASTQKNLVGVLGMLKGGVNPNVKNAQGNTPLIISASLGDTVSVRNLLAYRADVNAANKDGNTALLYAARYNHPDTVLALLSPLTMQYRVDINAQNKKGETALYWAAQKGYGPVVKILLANDADKTIKTKAGLTALDIAKKYNQQAVMKLLQMDINQLKDSYNQDQRARAAAAAAARR